MATHLGVICKELEKFVPQAIEKLSLERLPSVSSLEENEVRVQMIATALNYYDLLMLVGKYQMKPPLPFIPCSEGAGVITEVGSKVKKFKKGDHVIVTSNFGTLVEELVVPENILLKIPNSLSLIQASAIYVGFMTAYHGLVQRGNLKKGETLLITGAAGGMGVIAITLGKLLGATVIAAVSNADKAKLCSDLGADFTINYSTQDLKKTVDSITQGKGVDVCYEVVGGEIFDKCTRCMAGEGRLLVIGFASGKISSVPANLPLIKGYSVVGVRAGASMALYPEKQEELLEKLSEWILQGNRCSAFVGHVVPIDKYKDAFKLIYERKALGKVVIQWKPEKTTSKL